MQTDKYDRELIDTIVKWKPKLVEQVKTIENKCGFPTVIYRSPSRLIKEGSVRPKLTYSIFPIWDDNAREQFEFAPGH